MAYPLPIYLIPFIFGAVVGSFLNVCICRLPKEESVVFPPSHCPQCDYRIRWYDNIPIASYLVLRGKCRSCGTRISLQYPLVELLNGLLTVFLFLRFGTTPTFLVLFVFCAALVVITFIDLEHQIIPDVISVPGILVGYLASLFVPVYTREVFLTGVTSGLGSLLILLSGYRWLSHREDDAGMLKQLVLLILFAVPAGLAVWHYSPVRHYHSWTDPLAGSWTDSLLGILVGGGSLLLVACAYEAITKKEGMGGGDIKLLAMMGAFLGWRAIPFIIFASSLVGSVIGITVMLLQKKDAKLALPFGPFLAFGAVLYIFYGRQIIQWYLHIGRAAGG
jgi:leader peptidase (prepilin peptidase)/N-methyltransferase